MHQKKRREAVVFPGGTLSPGKMVGSVDLSFAFIKYLTVGDKMSRPLEGPRTADCAVAAAQTVPGAGTRRVRIILKSHFLFNEYFKS